MATHPIDPLPALKVRISIFEMPFPHESNLTLILAHDEDGEMVGTITVKRAGRVAEFNRLFVVPGVRRCGVGKRLVEFVVDAARTGQCEAVSGYVHHKNADALEFYRKLGFFEATRFDDGGVVMTCQL